MRPFTETAFVTHDARFADVLGDDPRLVEVVAVDAHEGPVYVIEEDALYFTSLPRPGPAPRVDVKRLALDGERFPLEPERVSLLCPDANVANGMASDRDRGLVVCEQGSRARPARIRRVDRRTGATEALVEAVDGLPLNSPNDVVVKGDGSVWFTDPSYGHLQGFRPAPLRDDAVYRHDPGTGATRPVTSGLEKPNGLAFSPDERVLYVTDSGADQGPGSFHADLPHHVVAFEVSDDGLLTDGRVAFVTTPGIPDGIKVDAAGRIYASAATGVQVFDPGGTPLGELRLPGAVNFAFGGPDGRVLFITTDTAIWAAVLDTQGA